MVLPNKANSAYFQTTGVYTGTKEDSFYFASESHPLNVLGCENVQKVIGDPLIVDIPVNYSDPIIHESSA